MDGIEQAPPRKRPMDSRPFLTLVEGEFRKEMANLPKAAWEPVSYLYTEAHKAILRVEHMHVPPELEWMRERTLQNWWKMLAWLDHVMQVSGSVNALRSWQLVSAMADPGDGPPRPSSGLVNTQNGEQEEKPRGLRLKR